jgi:threonine dehydratase
MITIDDIHLARNRIQDSIETTPLLSSDRLNTALPFDLYIKAECLQRTGSFKFRGGCNAVFSIDDSALPVIAFSSGNHAQAVALAARLSHRKATIIMPEDAPAAKITGTKSYGAEVVLYDRYTQSREEIGARLAAEQGAKLIKPYDDEHVIAGQGTAGLEICEQADRRSVSIDHYISCCGGGGLLAGTSTAISHLSPATKLYSAEPEAFNDTERSLAAGTRLSNAPDARSICDAIVTPCPGEITFPILQKTGCSGLSASDEDALHAMHIAWSYFKLTTEPGGAIALACALTPEFLSRFDAASQRQNVVVMVSGGNVDKDMFTRALSQSLRF